MKTSKWITAASMAVALAGIAFGMSGCKASESGQTQNQGGNKAVLYTCAMHPEIVQNKPGKCPKCGMDLIEKN